MIPQLGLGLIEIGRPWGWREKQPPGEHAALRLLGEAYQLGIRYFDTAPSYGYSEQYFGKFLASMTPEERAGISIATKFGERWDFERGQAVVDHSYDSLCRSLERSLELLGRIDLLQLHRCTPEVLRSPDVERAWEFTRARGVQAIGASTSDIESARVALDMGIFPMLQMPFNRERAEFEPILEEAHRRGKWLALNRPLGAGKLVADGLEEAFLWVMRHKFHGVVLSGTQSVPHLRENHEVFQRVREKVSAEK